MFQQRGRGVRLRRQVFAAPATPGRLQELASVIVPRPRSPFRGQVVASKLPGAPPSAPNRWPATLEGATWVVDRPGVLTGTYSLAFDGIDDDCVFATAGTGPLANIGTGAFTAAGWLAKTAATGSYEFLLGNWSTTGLMLGHNPSRNPVVYVGDSTEIYASTVIPLDGTWHHLAVTRDGSGNVTLYYDGSSIISGSGHSGSLSSGNGNYLGQRSNTIQWYEGHLADWRVYSVALSGSDISTLVSGGNPTSNPTAWWKMNEGTGGTANDSAP